MTTAAIEYAPLHSDVTSLLIETCDPDIVERIASAVRATARLPGHAGADVRYAIRLRDHDGRVSRIDLDAFGLRGCIDGRPVRFANDGIKRAIVRAYPQLSS